MTGHLTNDQSYIPLTRSSLSLPDFDPSKEDLVGSSVAEEVQGQLAEALSDSPVVKAIIYLTVGLPLYFIANVKGQPHYPRFTNHFFPGKPLFFPRHRNQVLFSDFGVFLWICALAAWSVNRGFTEVFRIYLVPYLWVNHWVVMITLLQHTDPLVPYYRDSAFTFARGSLATLDRGLLGEPGTIVGWIGGTLTHGVTENHVAHHLCSKIPHYHAGDATRALRKRLIAEGYNLQGAPAGWKEVVRVLRECKFVEDTGDVVFYKNSRGFAAAKPVFSE